MTSKKRVAILTSGGDAPGMNCCLNSFVKKAGKLGIEAIGVPDGFKGLCEEEFFELTPQLCAPYIKTGGTFLGTARYPEFLKASVREKCAQRLRKEGIEAIVGIGGDGTYQGLKCLGDLGFGIVAIPGSIDNDVPFTGYSIGFHTALCTIVDAIDRIRDTMQSHKRLFIVQTMGRHCPDLALYSGLGCAADIVLSQAETPDYDDVLKRVKALLASGQRSVLIVTSEHLIDAEDWAKRLGQEAGIETRVDILGHLQRGGTPSPMDRIIATAMGLRAAEICSTPNICSAVGICAGVIVETPLKADNRDCSASGNLNKLVIEAERKAR